MSSLVYVKFVSVLPTGKFVYDFYFSDTPDVVWGKGWDDYNIRLIDDPAPEESTYQEIIQLELPYKLKTAQENNCYPMEYAIYGIIALAWIDLNGLTEYPDEGRMVLHFGDDKDTVNKILEPFGLSLPE